MTSRNLDTIKAYYKAGEIGDWAAAGRCVARGYVWIDHGTGVVARSPDELKAALEDDDVWSTRKFDIEHVFQVEDGTTIVQGVRSGNLNGSWRSMDTTGQRVSFPFCAIFRFDADGLIVHEEAYYDMLSVRQQLGY